MDRRAGSWPTRSSTASPCRGAPELPPLQHPDRRDGGFPTRWRLETWMRCHCQESEDVFGPPLDSRETRGVVAASAFQASRRRPWNIAGVVFHGSAIVAGNGLGLLNTSLNIVGAAGVLGQSVLGQGSSRAFVNVANGNLVLQTQDAAARRSRTGSLRAAHLQLAGRADRWRWGWLALGLRADGEVPGTGCARAAGSGCHGGPHRW